MLIIDDLEKREKETIMKSLNTHFYPPVKPPGDGWIDECGVQESGLGWLDIQIGNPQQICGD